LNIQIIKYLNSSSSSIQLLTFTFIA